MSWAAAVLTDYWGYIFCLQTRAEKTKFLFVSLVQICVLLFTCLYMVCYLILTHFKKTAEFITGEFDSFWMWVCIKESSVSWLSINSSLRTALRKTNNVDMHTDYTEVLEFLSTECVGNMFSCLHKSYSETRCLTKEFVLFFCSAFIVVYCFVHCPFLSSHVCTFNKVCPFLLGPSLTSHSELWFEKPGDIVEETFARCAASCLKRRWSGNKMLQDKVETLNSYELSGRDKWLSPWG